MSSVDKANNDGQDQLPEMVVIMGVTGSGKSYMINKLAGSNVAETSARLNSCTSQCQMIPADIGKTKVLLVDTPGFDDTERSDTDILSEISRLLAAQYQLGIKLKGVIYLHRITDDRFQGASMKAMKIFRKICGQEALRNVILVTTRWGEVEESLGASRENQLRSEFWAYMLHNGSHMTRFYGDRDSAIGIASQLLGKQSIVLDLQKEIVDEGRALKDTAAGSEIMGDVLELKAHYEEQIRDLEDFRKELQANDEAMRLQVQQDWERERAMLHKIHNNERDLQSHVGTEVRNQIQAEEKRRGFRWSSLLPLVPHVLGLLGMFVGIPPGTISTLGSWFLDSDFGDSVTEFFASF